MKRLYMERFSTSDISQTDDDLPLFGEIEGYVRYLKYERNMSPYTLSAYLSDLRDYQLFLVEIGEGADFSPSGLDRDRVRKWLSQEMGRGLAPRSVRRKLSSLKSFYLYLQKNGRIENNPVRYLRGPKVEKPLPAFIPDQEMDELLGMPYDDTDFEQMRDHLLLEMLYQTGIRRSECAALKDTDVDIQSRKIKVLGKRNKERIIPFGIGLAELIGKWRVLRDEKIVRPDSFFVSLSGSPLEVKDVYHIVHRVLIHFPHLARRGPHVLRHSFATAMLNEGADLLAVKELLGHQSLSTTVGYTHSTFGQLKQMYNAHPRAKKQDVMNVRIQALHFDATDQLKQFIEKKLSKLERFVEDAMVAEVVLKVVKPETVENKHASIQIPVRGAELFAQKSSDTFEAAIDECIDALKKQIERLKDR
ncbi:ribosome hibernation-promoting factor, HPF/YfiA family [Porphyromonas crevioricanis]|nr:ribosome-associated translation inhibitor RaiA [Porphyromonas crevioricanis]